MTIYSQHQSRGKTQILATYRSSTGLTSTTVTSLADPAQAFPIVDALNRVSAAATVPVSVYDRRGDGFERYPREHLVALVDRGARDDLLDGAHSLWYELATLLLHQALTDLDDALVTVPAPVRTAIEAELTTEERELRAALAEFSEGVELPDSESPRLWDSDSPMVILGEERDDLNSGTREALDRIEQKLTPDDIEDALADLRLLATAYAHYKGDSGTLDTEYFQIFNEPYDSDGYFLTVGTPHRENGDGAWQVEVCHWEPNDPDDEECSSATGEPLVTCACSVPPTVSEIADLLHRSEAEPDRLATWAETPVGETLAGSEFTVTVRHHT
jgi:hypothetical protein